MKPKINTKQLVAILNLIKRLKEVEAQKIAFFKDIICMVNFNFPNDIFLRYEKEYFEGDGGKYAIKIAQINEDGVVKFIDDDFKNIFERYSFLGECKTFDIENPDDYEKID